MGVGKRAGAKLKVPQQLTHTLPAMFQGLYGSCNGSSSFYKRKRTTRDHEQISDCLHSSLHLLATARRIRECGYPWPETLRSAPSQPLSLPQEKRGFPRVGLPQKSSVFIEWSTSYHPAIISYWGTPNDGTPHI